VELVTQPRRTQAERREHTRRQLIAATVQCIAHDGYKATTTRRVAQTAGVSLGALAHHFPSRLDLIAAALDDVDQRLVNDFRERAGATKRRPDTKQLLDLVWNYWSSDPFTVWLRIWIAAAEEPELHDRMAPIERRFNDAIASLATELTPPHLQPDAWRSRFGAAMHAMRGLALSLAIEPREPVSTRDPWPTLRRELTALIDRRP
jgi:AcrR family transcriptional regulator